MNEEEAVTRGQAAAGDALDLNRHMYAKATLTQLRGLYLVTYGAALSSWGAVQVYWKGNEEAAFLGFVLPFGAAFLISIFWIPRYYARRFGVLRGNISLATIPWRSWNRRLFVVGILTFLALWVMIDSLQRLANPPVDLIRPLIVLAIPWGLLVVPFYSLRSARAVGLVTLMAVAVAMLYLVPIWFSLDAQKLVFWKVLDAGAAGFCVILIGLCDHISLTQVLPNNNLGELQGENHL